MNSATARVLLGSSAYVAKWVPSGHLADLRTGLEVARELSLAGLPAGAPLPAASGALSVPSRVVTWRCSPGCPAFR